VPAPRRVFSGSCRGRYQRMLGHAIRKKDGQIDRVVDDSRISLDSGIKFRIHRRNENRRDVTIAERRKIDTQVSD